MVWETNTSFMLMLTREIESDRVKCMKYWPDQGSPQQFGNINISLIEYKEEEHLIRRTLILENLQTKQQHKVNHFQYTGWPE